MKNTIFQYRNCAFAIITSIVLLITTFKLLQGDTIFTKFLENYENTNNEIKKVHKPYNKITNENLIQWDAVHYYEICKNGYNNDRNYLYAFFPLFPLLWKITTLPATGIIALNYLMFAISLGILWKFLTKDKGFLIYFLLLNLPFIAPFIIPYTESLFFLSITLAIIGHLKGKYWLYFIGALLTAMTRSAITIILLTIVITEGITFFKERDIKASLNRFLFSMVPLLIGTFAVLVYQKISGAESLFSYVDAIKTWDRKFGFPSNLRDWSHEGFGLNIATIFFILPVSIFVLVKKLFKLRKPEQIIDPDTQICNHKEEYLLVLSTVYIIGMFLTNLLFQGGSINGLFRYTLCTPFFFYLLIYFFRRLKSLNYSSKLLYYIFASFSGLFTMTMSVYSGNWNLSDAGFILLMITFGLLIFNNDLHQKKPYRIILGITIFLNIVWNTYMLNIYVSNGWIFT
jgi:hypothetical protein